MPTGLETDPGRGFRVSMPLDVRELPLAGLLLIGPRRFTDLRGTFEESWSRRDYQAVGIDVDFVQDNHSVSTHAGTLRGMHFQAPPYAQGKLVRCTRGAIYDGAVDSRRGSSSYGGWYGVTLAPETGQQLFVPEGFLHGFLTLEPNTEVQYKCTAPYDAASDGTVRWDSLGITWPLQTQPILSPKDAAGSTFQELLSPFSMRST